MSDLFCPNCGAEEKHIQLIEETNKLTLGKEFKYEIPMYVCNMCDEEIETAGNGDEIRITAIKSAKKELACSLIEEIKDKGMNLSSIERALELPQHTISSKWRYGISASGLALLRIVSAMPFIVNIADAKFTSNAIGKEIAHVLQAGGGRRLSYDVLGLKPRK